MAAPLKREEMAKAHAIGAEQILDWRAEAKSVREICVKCGRINPRSLYAWLDREGLRPAWDEASRLAAEHRADEVLTIADGEGAAFETGETIARDRLRVEARKWAAESGDRLKYGRQLGANVTVNIADLHLVAVQQVAREQQQAKELAGKVEVVLGAVASTQPDRLSAGEVVASTQPEGLSVGEHTSNATSLARQAVGSDENDSQSAPYDYRHLLD
jgi:hypothetical protein